MKTAKTVDTLRERERELYFNEIKHSLFSKFLFILDSNKPTII